MRLLALSLCLLSGAASANVIWRGDFETGNLSQWTGLNGLLSRLTVVTDPVRQGRYALRTEVRQGDVNSNGTRNELTLASSQFQEVEGNDKWYAWSTLFPADYPSNNTWQVFTQWHHSGCCGSPPVEFSVYGERIQLAHDGGTVLWSTPLVRGVWHDFVVHVYWSSTAGYVDLYYDGAKVLDHKATQTLYPGEYTYLKQGLYRNANITQVGIVYHDGMVMGTSLADVAPQLAAPPPPPPPPPSDAGPPADPPPGPAADAGSSPPVDPVPPVSIGDAGIPLQTGALGYRLPGGGCSHTARDSLAVLGVLAGALFAFRRRR